MEEKVKSTTQKQKKKKIYLVIVTIILAVIVISVAVNQSNTKPTVNSTPKIFAKVRISEDGFEPSTLKIKAGTAVIWINDDTQPHRIAANPVSTHSSLPTLDSKHNIATNGTYRYVFIRTGSFGYHDELNPQINGTIIITP